MKYHVKPDIRTTLGEFLAKQDDTEIPGVYVIACYPSLGVLYIGVSNNIRRRFREHLSQESELSNFIKNNFVDACGWRLDLFIEKNKNDRLYIESKFIKKFRPMFNIQQNTRCNVDHEIM